MEGNTTGLMGVMDSLSSEAFRLVTVIVVDELSSWVLPGKLSPHESLSNCHKRYSVGIAGTYRLTYGCQGGTGYTSSVYNTARGRYCKQLRGYPVLPRRAPYVNLFVA